MVKRVGNLMQRIASLENLHEAFLRAAKGKSDKCAVKEFRSRLDKNLCEIGRQLLDGSFQFGKYHFFTVYDPKKRMICAASFPERVVFHAMMRICHPVFDDFQIFDSYASRVGKGTYKALERSEYFAHRYRWFVKLDICKYFDSIDHDVMMQQLCRLFKDPQLLIFFRNMLDGYETIKGCGLPIGNLTSQYFANHYLAVADHYVKEQLHVKAMVRYMDDVLLFSDDKEQLKSQVRGFVDFVEHNLHLCVHQPVMNKTCYGIPFLGYVVYPDCLRLNQRSRRRFCQKMDALTDNLLSERMSEWEFSMRASCLHAFIDKADSFGFRYNYYHSNVSRGALTA